jgi:hypothetical protein
MICPLYQVLVVTTSGFTIIFVVVCCYSLGFTLRKGIIQLQLSFCEEVWKLKCWNYVGWVVVLVRENGTGWRLYLRLAQQTSRTDKCTCWRFKSSGILRLLVCCPKRLKYSSPPLWEHISLSLFGVDHVRVSQIFFLDALFLFKILNFHCVFLALSSEISYLVF